MENISTTNYISREAAKIAVCRSRCRTYCQRGCCELTEAIRKIPAAYVRENKKGKWQSWTQDRPPYKWYSCDYCGFHSLAETPYCPNCGCDMRGADDAS